jgi:hypothetical protein
MVRNIKRHGDNDQYSNGELEEYKMMIEDSRRHSIMVVQLSIRDCL